MLAIFELVVTCATGFRLSLRFPHDYVQVYSGLLMAGDVALLGLLAIGAGFFRGLAGECRHSLVATITIPFLLLASVGPVSDFIHQGARLFAGSLLREGLGRQARAHGLRVTQSGPVQLPFLTFASDVAAGTFDRANVFTGEAARRGVWLHPWHNWFLSTAHTDADIQLTLERTDAAFAAVRARFGPDAGLDGMAT